MLSLSPGHCKRVELGIGRVHILERAILFFLKKVYFVNGLLTIKHMNKVSFGGSFDLLRNELLGGVFTGGIAEHVQAHSNGK